MSKSKKLTIEVLGTSITVLSQNDEDYISLTDMLKAKDGDFFIADWLRNRNTVEFLGIWERVHNPGFNYGEFATIKSQAGLNSYRISVKDWVAKTNALGLRATTGRYGGTYAHKDIAFEFGMWISAEFKVYLIKEFQRLKDEENDRLKLGWNLQRTLSKINYRIHTDAIRETLIPPAINKSQASLVYATEADVLNVALFGQTAKEWRNAHPDAEAEEMGGKRKFFTGNFARYGWAKLMSAGIGGHELIGLYGEGISTMPQNPGIPALFRDIFKNAYLSLFYRSTLKPSPLFVSDLLYLR
ncbi:MAG: KilA-N domain-containing protein [Polaromonas sp.]